MRSTRTRRVGPVRALSLATAVGVLVLGAAASTAGASTAGATSSGGPSTATAGVGVSTGTSAAAASSDPAYRPAPASRAHTVRSRADRGWPRMDPMAAEVVRLTNVERSRAGCPALRIDSRLNTAARLHSEDMARQDYFSHTSLDGRTWDQRIRAQGYGAPSGENIAAGYPDAASVMRGWMNSEGHRANILTCSHRAIGVGIGRGGSYGIYWTQNFGRE